MRLIGDSISNGKLEIGIGDDHWTTVCASGFGNAAAIVACRQLGYDHGLYYSMYVLLCNNGHYKRMKIEHDYHAGAFICYSGSEQAYGVCQVNCTGNEKWIQDCIIIWRLSLDQCYNCFMNEVVGISCGKKRIARVLTYITINTNSSIPVCE